MPKAGSWERLPSLDTVPCTDIIAVIVLGNLRHLLGITGIYGALHRGQGGGYELT